MAQDKELAQKLDVIMAMSCIVNGISDAAGLAHMYGFMEIEAELADILIRTVEDTRKLLQEVTG